jgi:transcriptional regulator with XRE-family HTH domain
MIDGRQIRAARALIGWGQNELADATGLSVQTIKNVEQKSHDPRSTTLNLIEMAFKDRGIIFIEGGVTKI